MQLTKDFQQILIDLFTKYDEKNLKTIPEIMKRFRQNKQQVILHLCNKYNVDINTLDGVDMRDEPIKPVAAAPTASAVEGDQDTSVEDDGGDSGDAVGDDSGDGGKKKSKMMMIIIIVIVGLGVLGGGGYFAYDMFMGDESPQSEEVEPAPESESEPEPEPVVVDTAATDSTATDSTATDSTVVEDGKAEGGDATE